MDKHHDYPHHPGSLYGCGACEAECFCEGNTAQLCIRCYDEMMNEMGMDELL